MRAVGDRETWQERTALAWQRTGLGVLAVAALMSFRAALQARPAFLAVAGGVALLGLAVLVGLAPARRRHVRRAVLTGDRLTARRAAAAVTAVVAATALAALVPVLEILLEPR